MSSGIPGNETGARGVLALYLQPRLLFVFVMGFASGLPLALSSATLSFWLAESGVALAAIGTCSMEDLAENSVDELMVIDGMDEERASALIMTARAPWFETEES